MRRTVSLIMAVILSALVAVNAFAADAEQAAVTSGRIIISENPTAKEQYASGILCERLNSIFGGYTVTNGEPVSGDIVVGRTPYSDYDFDGKKAGSYAIKSEDGCTYIDGNGNDGLIGGVYEFLENFCDYEVYEKNIIRFTDKDRLTLPDDINIEYEPYFEYRKVDTASSYDSEYCHANSINTNVEFSDDRGGMIKYISWSGHTLAREFCARETYFEQYPECYAVHDGKRTSNQLCLTNEKTLEIVTGEVLQLLRDKHDPTKDIQIVSLTQDDNGDYCECPACKAIDDENGSHAGTVITFVNKVADRVKAEGYSNIAIDTFAYQWSRKVPSKVVPRDNVVVRLCSIECCFAHSIDEPCRMNAEFLEDLKGWSRICNRLYIWDYVNNYSETFLPFPNFSVLQRNVQVFYECGAKGYYAEGNYYMNICDGEFYELRSYLISKLMENPYRDDYYTLMDNYLDTVYGPGGRYLREYIDATCELARNHKKNSDDARMHIRQQPKHCLPGITRVQIKHFDELWQKAKDAAGTDEQLYRVKKSETSWEYWKASRLKGKYTLVQSPYKYMKSHTELLERILYFGNTAMGEGDIKYLRKNPARVLFFGPLKWEAKFDGKIYDKFDSFAKWLYELMGGEYNFEY